MAVSLPDLLAERGTLLADGATGTNLFERGLNIGEAPEFWAVDRPEEVAALHQGFVDAGADIILTDSFGANRRRLKLHGAEHRAAELAEAAARLARRVADATRRPVAVGGTMGPTGDLLEPFGELAPEEAKAVFAEQAAALAEGGTDVLWIETLSASDEMAAAIAAAATTGLPVIATMSFDSAGRTMMGLAPEDYARFCRGISPPPLGYGANCGVGAPELLHSLLGMARVAELDDVLVAKANCGVPTYVEGRLVYSGTVEVMGAYAALARDIGARIVGGCCGTTPAHLAAMRRALDETPRGEPPTLAAITAAIGQPWPGPAASGGDPGRRERRGRRRGN